MFLLLTLPSPCSVSPPTLLCVRCAPTSVCVVCVAVRPCELLFQQGRTLVGACACIPVCSLWCLQMGGRGGGYVYRVCVRWERRGGTRATRETRGGRRQKDQFTQESAVCVCVCHRGDTMRFVTASRGEPLPPGLSSSSSPSVCATGRRGLESPTDTLFICPGSNTGAALRGGSADAAPSNTCFIEGASVCRTTLRRREERGEAGLPSVRGYDSRTLSPPESVEPEGASLLTGGRSDRWPPLDDLTMATPGGGGGGGTRALPVSRGAGGARPLT